MSIDPKKIRLERFLAEVGYHAAWNYLSLKGVIPERWGHGPLFGAVTDQGNQVTLSPAAGIEEENVAAVYGVRASSYDRECVQDREQAQSEAKRWLRDVLEVLSPRRTTKVRLSWFALYPFATQQSAESADARLKARYFDESNLEPLLPDGYSSHFAAVNSFCMDQGRQWSLEMGLVGPPHKGNFFAVPVAERDTKWWMGLKFTLIRRDEEEGLGPAPADILDALIAEGSSEYDRLILQGFGSVT
jgi:hypothetical protein